jgi:glyoxalase family protein
VQLHGIHHITAITADARRNVDFYARLLGLRMVKKTVNFDAPDFYHLYYGDELGNPGSILTFFEFPHAPPGKASAGMIHRIIWRVAGERSLEFWESRLGAEGVEADYDNAALTLRFRDPEGLDLELEVTETDHDPPLKAAAPDIPAEHALLGFKGVRAYSAHPEVSHDLLTEALGFRVLADNVEYRLQGGLREALYHYDEPPLDPPVQGAGTVHHIAWAAEDSDHAAWRERLVEERVYPTEIIDRFYFRSIYFREPSGVLFEIATLGPGFTVDESAEHLGESLMLPSQHEPLRPHLEQKLTLLTNPRAQAVGG